MAARPAGTLGGEGVEPIELGRVIVDHGQVLSQSDGIAECAALFELSLHDAVLVAIHLDAASLAQPLEQGGAQRDLTGDCRRVGDQALCKHLQLSVR